MNLHWIYLLSSLLVVGSALLGYRTYRLQRHIRRELKALRLANDAKARQARLAASLADDRLRSDAFDVVTNPEGGLNSYGHASVNRPVQIQNSYSL